MGSEDPRKIDSTWHIPQGSGKRELGLSQLTQVMVAVGEKMGAEVERENNGAVCGPACRRGVVRVPGNGYPYPIWTPLRTAASPAHSRSRNYKVPIPVLVKRTPRTPRSDASNSGAGQLRAK